MSIVAQLCRYLEPGDEIPVSMPVVREAIRFGLAARNLGMKAPEHERLDGEAGLWLKWHTCAYQLDVSIRSDGTKTVRFQLDNQGFWASERLVPMLMGYASSVQKAGGCCICRLKPLLEESAR